MFTDERILKIARNVKDGIKQYKEKEASGKYNTMYLLDIKNGLETAFHNDLQAYYDDRIQKNRDIQEKIKKTYESNLKPVDPTAELLRRQDIQIKLSLASDDDLKEQVQEFVQTGEGDVTALNMLRAELKNRNLDTENVTVKAYMDEYSVETPYARDEKYIQAEQDILDINSYRNTGYLHVGEGELREVIPLTIEMKGAGQ